MASPPFSPLTSSLLLPPGPERSGPLFEPPGHMVMSPPNPGPLSVLANGAANGHASAGGALPTIAEAGSEAGPLGRERSGGLAIDLACLPPPEQRGLTLNAAPPQHAVGPQPGAAAQNGHAAHPVRGTSASAPPIPVPHVSLGPASGSLAAAAAGAAGKAQPGRAAALPATAHPLAASEVGTPPRAGGPSGSAAATPSRASAFSAAAASAMSAAASGLAERIAALRRELGEGEGVSGLLERSRAAGGSALVAAVDEDGVMSDDERPLSPLSRIRYDTFGATLEFITALCDASSVLTTYAQARARAARLLSVFRGTEIRCAAKAARVMERA